MIGMPKGEDQDSYAAYTETLDSFYFIKLKVMWGKNINEDCWALWEREMY